MKNFNYSIDNFRGVSIIFVMFSHLETFASLGFLGEVLHFIFVNASAWFVFISGYLFFKLENKNFTYEIYFLKKIKNVMIPYLILSLPGIVFGIILNKPAIFEITIINYIIWSLLAGGMMVPPLWFMPMMFIFFGLSPIFNKLGRSRYIFSAMMGGMLISIFTFRSIGNLNPLLSFIHFIGFFILGIYVAKNSEIIDLLLKEKIYYQLSMFVGFIIFISTFIFQKKYNPLPNGFFSGIGEVNFYQLNKLGLLIIVYVIFNKFLSKKNKFLKPFSELSFGLFFIHGFFMVIFNKIKNYLDLNNPLYVMYTEIFVVIVISIIVTKFAKILLGARSRYVIGC